MPTQKKVKNFGNKTNMKNTQQQQQQQHHHQRIHIVKFKKQNTFANCRTPKKKERKQKKKEKTASTIEKKEFIATHNRNVLTQTVFGLNEIKQFRHCVHVIEFLSTMKTRLQDYKNGNKQTHCCCFQIKAKKKIFFFCFALFSVIQ